ncbi:hypothetical protein [Hydrogenimonas cancrithermarum]|uniref:Uncharacterized protein n=1 Tax=Hydrogenimonas cancrithermarum TaxID=2993563 RepID=A0ABM8FPX9_9BACT|nr:hypothetical protein [Hydrogenimonas cancrithermarum]BDY13974.1 hypothetical protein HCR_22870 [Hydrogenimonas cancrithermarum]
MHLRRQTPEVYYFKGKQEVNLYASVGKEVLVNVGYQIDRPVTLRREVDALIEGMVWFCLKHSLLITADKEEVIEKEGCVIKV